MATITLQPATTNWHLALGNLVCPRWNRCNWIISRQLSRQESLKRPRMEINGAMRIACIWGSCAQRPLEWRRQHHTARSQTKTHGALNDQRRKCGGPLNSKQFSFAPHGFCIISSWVHLWWICGNIVSLLRNLRFIMLTELTRRVLGETRYSASEGHHTRTLQLNFEITDNAVF